MISASKNELTDLLQVERWKRKQFIRARELAIDIFDRSLILRVYAKAFNQITDQNNKPSDLGASRLPTPAVIQMLKDIPEVRMPIYDR